MKQDFYYQSQRPEIANLVPENAIHILDVGCGAGGLGKSLLEKNPSRFLYGIELSEDAAKKAKEHYTEVLVSEIEGMAFPYEEKFFDTIIFADVLEHLLDPWSLLEKIQPFLKDDGVIISSIPNIGHWSIIHQLMCGSWQYVEAGILDKTHLRFFTKHSILSMLRNSGYKTIYMTGTTTGSNPLNKPEMRAALESFQINPDQSFADSFVFQYINVAQKLIFQDKTSIIIPVDEDSALTSQCISFIQEKTPELLYEIILVGDIPKSLEDEVSSHNNIRCINSEKDANFSQKINKALELVTNKYLCLMNSNAIVTNGWLQRLIECMESDEKVALTGPRSNGLPGSQEDKGCPVKSLHDIEGYAEKVFYQYVNNWYETDKLQAFCSLVKTDAMKKSGGLNESLNNEKTAFGSLCNTIKQDGCTMKIAYDTFIFMKD
ncbi:MAG: methyltransferase domain-containing protein [Nitrospinae bacterium]|nr:methyltransferase domain-containing protein [Nitrospinota bacterium]